MVEIQWIQNGHNVPLGEGKKRQTTDAPASREHTRAVIVPAINDGCREEDSAVGSANHLARGANPPTAPRSAPSPQ